MTIVENLKQMKISKLNKQKLVDDMCNLISDYLYNNNFTIKDIETAFDKAKLKLRKQIGELYERTNN
tara:strand:- start:1220 stop:1420 length:201 start_codon:yes stop_codon:yes gene_type:complete